MPRLFPLMLTFTCGLAVGLLARNRPARPAPELPPIDFAEPVTVRRMTPDSAEVIKLSPYAVLVDGKNRPLGPVPPELWLITFDRGRMQIACALEERN
ncbi:hypothetical protein R5W24_006227 [Gemmata sp. JC717]|uniref:Uncharacterized protein n=1 Tax=Gemmata algarum TaxID=2975278 RepID=A0ABU5EVQ7_9BACT|nr:hypothetical protein [Gemmata algarum]MDY3557043.1 hypothetical protein [Gemmata algarum]MDY3558732.1 hypothetical protein [Gemmata algarum]